MKKKIPEIFPKQTMSPAREIMMKRFSEKKSLINDDDDNDNGWSVG